MGKTIIRRSATRIRAATTKNRRGWWGPWNGDQWICCVDLVKYGGNIVRAIFATIETPIMEAKMRLIQAGQIMASESLTASEMDPSG